MAKTAKQKAQEALDVATRKLERATAKHTEAKAAVASLEAEIKGLTKERDYLASHPALEQETEPEPVPVDEPSDEAKADKASVTSTPDLGF